MWCVPQCMKATMATSGGNTNTKSKNVNVKALVSIQQSDGGLIPNLTNSAIDGIKELVGKTLVLELVSDDLDPKTNSEKKTTKNSVQFVEKKEDVVWYETQFELSKGFGNVGAVIIENEQHQELFLKNIVLYGFPGGPLHFTCNSWIQPNHDAAMKRVFFTHKSYLPSQTPRGLQRLRKEELVLLRGNGEGECKSCDRIYDYDVYNDLGDPDTNIHLKRPVLGGTKQYPYPRRCRTGRKHSDADSLSEKKSSRFYVPRDEVFGEMKQTQFTTSTVSLGLNAIFESLDTILTDPDLGFLSFEDIDTLYKEGFHLPPLKANGLTLLQKVIPKLIKAAKDTQNMLRFDPPEAFKILYYNKNYCVG
ncbi:Linoleate 13S-lipoxygenase 2-1, chloroplastic, partial [Mucuna pruriens]